MSYSGLRPLFVHRPTIVAGALALMSMAPSASSAPQAWAKQFGTAGLDILTDVLSDGAGGSIAVGYTTEALGGPHQGGLDAYFERRDAAGNVLWTDQIGTPQPDLASGVASDGQGGCFTAGISQGALGAPNQGSHDVFLARHDAGGNLLWIVGLGSAGDDNATGIAPDGTGGVFVTGYTSGSLAAPSSGQRDAWVARFDSSGGLVWSKQFGSSLHDYADFATEDGSGGVVVGGRTEGDLASVSAGGHDGWYANFDSAGTLLWQRQFGGPADEHVLDAVGDGSGGMFLAGNCTAPFPGLSSFGAFVMRVDAQGNILWATAKAIHGTDDDVVELASDGAGGVFALGNHQYKVQSSPSTWNSQVFLARYDSAGNPLFEIPFGCPEHDSAGGLASYGRGAVVVVGQTEGSLFASYSGFHDAWIARFESCDFDAFAGYCPAAVNSSGEPAAIGHWGSASVTRNDLTLTVDNGPSSQVGLFLMSGQQGSVPFGDGTLCLAGSISRILPGVFLEPHGWASLPLDFGDPSSPVSQVSAGSTWNFQCWFRDTNAGGTGFNLSNGLSATFCP